jgi:adenine-specific DNA methylase
VIPKDCKRLAEVDFPIAEVSKHAIREKSIRHGYPSTLHLWWARRPLGSSRAILLGLLLPDPGDPLCPPEFITQARSLLSSLQGRVGPSNEDLRRALLKLIAEFANWDLTTNQTYIDVGRALVKLANGNEPPLVVDPFAGGGSIPLEALRLGCDVFASDINPVAGLILKIMLEDVPRSIARLPDVQSRCLEIRSAAESQVEEFYPPDPDGGRPTAYFWVRTVQCESPNCGAEIPLTSSFWLSKKPTHRRAIRPVVSRQVGKVPAVSFELFQPIAESDVIPGTAKGGKAQCLCCSTVMQPKRLQLLMQSQGNGIDVRFDTAGNRVGGARLLAVAVQRAGMPGREYRLADDRDYALVRMAVGRVRELELADAGIFPTEIVNPVRPSPNARGLSAVTRYGASTFSHLFNARQKLSLSFLAEAIKNACAEGGSDGTLAVELAAAALAKRADYSSGGTRWHLTFEKATCTFSKQALSQAWDYVEPTAVGSTSGSYGAGFETVFQAVDGLAKARYNPGQVSQEDAAHSPLPDASASVWFTDPPYYDAIPYADLADYFFVWMKRAMPLHPALFSRVDPETGLTPKQEECVWNSSYSVDGRSKDGRFFERTAAKAFAEGRRILRDEGVGTVVFAHKTTEGWEALLSGMIAGGWVVTASWPVATERAGRLQSQGSAALATSVHLVCRPRAQDAGVGDWADVLRELPTRVADWMERLQNEGVRGADLVFACIGPALEIFSRYRSVETAEGREVKLDEYLQKVWEVVGRSALAQVLGTAEAKARNGAAGAVEEDARLTALFLWTLQATEVETTDDADDSEDDEEDVDDEDEEASSPRKAKGFTLVFDVVRRFAQPLGIELPKWEGRVIETKKGVVRLLPISERAKQLFGEEGAHAVAARLEEDSSLGLRPQLSLFPEERQPELKLRERRSRSKSATVRDESLHAPREATTLDRVHAAMLLQASGRANALRALLSAEQERSPDFLRLANALSALYPKVSEEKRLLDAMLLAVPR